MTTTPVLRLRDVAKSYAGPDGSPVQVLRGVNLTLRAGEKASLVGPSGIGKSTLLSLVAGLLRPDTGTIEVGAVDTDGLDDRGRSALRADRVGIALQSDNLIPFLSAAENVELALAFATRRRRGAARRARALELLDRLGVAHRAEHRPRQLSGGEAQRVALAVALANEPVLLLADEVVAQLDRNTAAGVVDEVLTADFAMLFVTHDLAIADLTETRYELVDHEVRAR